MTTIEEVLAGEARVKALVKNIKPVDTSKVVLQERKDDTLTTTEMCLEREALMLEDIKRITKSDISKVQLPEKPSRLSSI